jgi:hypothetical protein
MTGDKYAARFEHFVNLGDYVFPVIQQMQNTLWRPSSPSLWGLGFFDFETYLQGYLKMSYFSIFNTSTGF